MADIIKFPGAPGDSQDWPERKKVARAQFIKDAAEEAFEEVCEIFEKDMVEPVYVRYLLDIYSEQEEPDVIDPNTPGGFSADRTIFVYNESMLSGLREYAQLMHPGNPIEKTSVLEQYFVLAGVTSELVADYASPPSIETGTTIQIGDRERVLTIGQTSRYNHWRAAASLAMSHCDPQPRRIISLVNFLDDAHTNLFEEISPELLGLMQPFSPTHLDEYMVGNQPPSNVVSIFSKK